MHELVRSTAKRRLLVLACLLNAGCAGTRPVHYYTLTSAQPHLTQGKEDGLTILVGNIAASESLQDVRIRYRVGANEEGAYEYHHWTERPGSMVRDGLMQALRSSGKYRRVLESSSSATGNYLIRGRLYAFDEMDNPGIQTRISLHLELIDKKTNRTAWDRLFERDEPAKGKSVKDVVASMDQNLSQVSNQAAAEIGTLLSDRR
ncbi:MAG: ABC-type transport auxiliary lipoprotein family protein [Bryobacteraceae bacterium]